MSLATQVQAGFTRVAQEAKAIWTVVNSKAKVTVSEATLSNAVGEDGDFWIDPDAPSGSVASYLHVGEDEPTFVGTGVWIQTGLGPNGQDWTMWIEDGT